MRFNKCHLFCLLNCILAGSILIHIEGCDKENKAADESVKTQPTTQSNPVNTQITSKIIKAPEQPAVQAAEIYRVITDADGLGCSFSQDLTISMGSTGNGNASGSAIHFSCVNKAGKEVEIELISKNQNENSAIENGKVAIRTKEFGTVYRGNEPGKFSTYEMTESNIIKLKKYLGFDEKSTTLPVPSTSSNAAPGDTAIRIEDLKAEDVAKDPAAYGFIKGGSMSTTPNEAGLRLGLKPSRDDQWTKKTPDGKIYLLKLHFEDDKLVYAKWGGL